VTDTLPAALAFGQANASQGACTQAAGTVHCSLGTLASGASATIAIVGSASALGTLTNAAAIFANQPDPNRAARVATPSPPGGQPARTGGPPRARHGSSTGRSARPAGPGTKLTCTVPATNVGPAPAPGVSVSDALPVGAAFVGVTTPQGSCSQAAGTVACTLG